MKTIKVKKIFAIIFVLIASLFSTDKIAFKAEAASIDNSLAVTYQSESKLFNEPTVIFEVVDAQSLNDILNASRKPSNVILRFNENADVLSKNGEVIDSFTNVYNKLKGKIIPILNVENQQSATAVIDYLKENDILDLAVISSVPNLVNQIKTVNKKIRGIIEYLQVDDLYEIVKTTNENQSMVALLPESFATVENVRYIQARFKTVWVRAQEKGMGYFNAINSGAYGIVTSDCDSVYDCLESYTNGGRTRSFFNVAHRGLPHSHNENSLEGIRASIASGATHVELDGHLTTDGKIVLMHDTAIDRTSNGVGNAEEYTLEQLQSYQLDLKLPNERIPSLEEAIIEMKGKDIIMMFEIKSSKPALVTELKSLLDKYDFYDQIICISFHTSMLAQMKTILPQVPTANLNGVDQNTFVDALYWMGEYNTGIATGYTNTNVYFNEAYLRDRGIIGWYWTFERGADVLSAVDSGYTGTTSNAADANSYLLRSLRGAEYKANTLSVGDVVPVIVTGFSGKEIIKEGRVFVLEDEGSYYNVIVTCRVMHNYYTQSYRVEKGVYIPAGDRSKLDSLLADCRALNKKDFTAESYASLLQAMGKVSTLSTYATQNQIDQVYSEIKNAYDQLAKTENNIMNNEVETRVVNNASVSSSSCSSSLTAIPEIASILALIGFAFVCKKRK